MRYKIGDKMDNLEKELKKDLEAALNLLANAECSDCGRPKKDCLWYDERAKLMGWKGTKRQLDINNASLLKYKQLKKRD